MVANIAVECLVDRVWDIASQTYIGTMKSGTLIDVSTQSDGAEFQPVGIVLFGDDSFEIVPFEFMHKL